MISREDRATIIHDIIIECVINAFKSSGKCSVDHIDTTTDLYGDPGSLDSLALVGMLIEIQDKIQQKLEVRVTIIDQSVFSTKGNPFTTVGSLVEYISNRIESK